MSRKVVAAKRCFFCNSCSSDSANNILNHCQRSHTDIDKLLGLSALTGYKFRRLDEEDNANILVAIKNEGNPRNVMYCLSCNRTCVSGDSAEPQSLAATFAKHDCSDHVRGPSKRRGLILGPRKKAEGMTATPATIRKDGIWLDKAILDSIKVKYPALSNCYVDIGTGEEVIIDFLATLEAIGKEVQVAENYQRAHRDVKAGTAKAPKGLSTDPWADVGRIVLEDDGLSDAYDQLTTSATTMYISEFEDWRIACTKDAIQKGLPLPYNDVEVDEDDDMPVESEELTPPDANIHRRVIRDALLAEARKLKRVSQKHPASVVEMPTVIHLNVPQVVEEPPSDCQSESVPHLQLG
jgi:hypothetical protein